MIDQLIQLALSIIAITCLFGLAKIYWPKQALLNKGRVYQAFSLSNHALTPEKIWLDAHQKAAFVTTKNPHIMGYARTLGDHIVCRPITHDSISLYQSGDKELEIQFTDYTLDNCTISFSSASDCYAVIKAFDKMSHPEYASSQIEVQND